MLDLLCTLPSTKERNEIKHRKGQGKEAMNLMVITVVATFIVYQLVRGLLLCALHTLFHNGPLRILSSCKIRHCSELSTGFPITLGWCS